eukprot:UN25189
MADSEDLYIVPGPSRVPKSALEEYARAYNSPDLDPQFVKDYASAEQKLRSFLGCDKDIHVTIQSGEGMLALWSGLKSTLQPKDVVVSICSGIFGYGVADMCEKLGCTVHRLKLEFDETFHTEEHGKSLKTLLETHKPKMVTMIHCETPSGTLNDLTLAGKIIKDFDTLFYVDFVASAGSVAVDVSKII